MSNQQNPLIELYGLNALNTALKEIENLKRDSNIPFDKELTQTGISFMMIKASQIIEGKKSKVSMKSLASESFGEAAIYKYNVINKN